VNRDDVSWAGYWPAVVTPFTEAGELDEDALRAVVSSAVDRGADGICVNGSTGEWFSQTADERRRVAEVAVAAVAGRVPTVVAVTCSRADDAASLAEHAARIGADSVMAAPPPLARPTERELEAYYREVFGAAAVPAWLYNFPQDNGHPIGPAEIARLARIPTVVAVKQSAAGLDELVATVEAAGAALRVFGTLLSRPGAALVAAGLGDGQVGSGMLLGADQPGFFVAARNGDRRRAEAIADRFGALMAGLAGPRPDGYNWAFGGMQATLKAAMNLLGEPGGHPRRPKLPVDDPTALEGIRRVLRGVGLDCPQPTPA
jgi:4-hydroxy-tetrahydrodipicolinate synthase